MKIELLKFVFVVKSRFIGGTETKRYVYPYYKLFTKGKTTPFSPYLLFRCQCSKSIDYDKDKEAEILKQNVF